MGRSIKTISLCLILLLLTAPALASSLEAVFLDVGSADCALFVSDGEAMMIDTGEGKADFSHIQEIMESFGAQSLKYLVLTHPHGDHIGNAARVIETYGVSQVILPPVEHDTKAYDAMIGKIDALGIEKLYPQVGDTLTLGGAEIAVYGPHPVAYRNVNDWSIVLMIRSQGRNILMTGDIEFEAEMDLLSFNDQYPLSADVLKVAHHGSDTSSAFAFIEAVSPSYAVVSCSSKKDREYPHVEIAMTLIDLSVQDIFTTEKAGDIYLSVDDNGNLLIGPITSFP